jgi:uncharacterized cofD-like protein
MSPRVVALGGGHGLAATLNSLRSLTSEITAVVTVADNGGSSGRLRQEFNQLPPGDLRMALAALCADDEWGRSWAQVLQHRFTSSGEMNGHAVGNLLLSALWDMDSNLVLGLDRVGELLKVVGRVLPMAIEPLDIAGTFRTKYGIQEVRGQVQVATTNGELQSLRLIPEQPQATPEVLAAIADAEWITIGPGSWFSSVMPHVLLNAQAGAISDSPAKIILIFNLPENERDGEFAGNSPEEHLQLLRNHLPNLHLDYAIADPSVITPTSTLAELVKSCGGELLVADITQRDNPHHHDPEKLTSVFAHIFG